MTIAVRILPGGAISFEGVGDPLFDTLRRMREAVEAGGEEVDRRLFPDPVENRSLEEDLIEDWNGIIQPDLQETFLSAREAVSADLRRAVQGSDGLWTFQIPKAHLDGWMNALTQARLALAEIHQFSEEEMSRTPSDLAMPREFALLQMGFYGMLLEWLLSVTS